MEGEELKVFLRYKKQFTNIKMNCIILFNFLCKSEYIDDSEAIIDELGSL